MCKKKKKKVHKDGKMVLVKILRDKYCPEVPVLSNICKPFSCHNVSCETFGLFPLWRVGVCSDYCLFYHILTNVAWNEICNLCVCHAGPCFDSKTHLLLRFWVDL